MNTVDRPTPVGVTKRGHPRYDPAELAAYRKANGATQAEVGGLMRCSGALIATFERTNNPRFDLQESTVLPLLDAIDRIARRRAAMVAEGLAEIEAFRAERERVPVAV
jgi:hypothetical protein